MPFYAYLIIFIGVVIWFYPFVPAHQKTSAASVVNRKSRWGVLLQLLAFTLVWQGHFWLRTLPAWRATVCLALFVVAIALSWTSSRALAGQLRIDAALGTNHTLVRSGPYAIVRNPIYTSMLAVLCAIAVVISGWKLFLASLLIFIVGTEIRVRTEESLLESRFGEEFRTYKRQVSGYIPFIV